MPRLAESELMRTGTPTGETMARARRTLGSGEGPLTGSAFVSRAVAVEDVAFYLCASALRMLFVLRTLPKHGITGDVCVWVACLESWEEFARWQTQLFDLQPE